MNPIKTFIKNNMFCVLVMLFCFQTLLQRWIPLFQYYDEVYAIIAVPLFAVWIFRGNRIKKYSIGMIVLLAVFMMAGLYANVIYGYQSLRVAFTDAFLNIKFFMAVSVTAFIFAVCPIEEERMLPLVRLIMLIFFVCFIGDIGFWVWNVYNGIQLSMQLRLFYEYPAYMGAVCAFLLSLIVAVLKDGIEKSVYIGALLLFMFMTFKSKIVGSAILFIVLYIWLIRLEHKFDFKLIAGLGVALLTIAWNKIQYYFVVMNDFSARSVLTNTSIQIAYDYFPFGTGFGTFASYYSGIYYSPVYQKYGIDKHLDLGEHTRRYISDTFWPMIVGQNGVVGLLCYVTALLLLFSLIQKIAKSDKKYYFMSLYAFLFLCIASIAESAFVNTYAVMLAVPIGIGMLKMAKKYNAGEAICPDKE